MNLQLDVSTLDDVALSPEDEEACYANIESVYLTRDIDFYGDRTEITLGGSVPSGVDFLKYVKFLDKKTYWILQAMRKQRETGQHLGTVMSNLKEEEFPI